MVDYVKIDDSSIKEIVPTETVYNYSELLQQKEHLVKDKQDMIKIFDAKIAKLDKLITECTALGIKG